MTHRQEKGCFQSVGGFKERYAERKGFVRKRSHQQNTQNEAHCKGGPVHLSLHK